MRRRIGPAVFVPLAALAGVSGLGPSIARAQEPATVARAQGSATAPPATAATAVAAAPAAPPSQAPSAAAPVAFGADEIRFDAASKSLQAVGHVRVDQPPFHFSSDALTLRRVPIGAVLDGSGRLSFCPCLGTPLAVRFSGATVSPPHDVILRNPVLEIFGVPVAWLPAFWLRSPGRVGLLPPDLAWRGGDGFFAGSGVHVPLRQGDTESGLDLRAGGYAEGGVAVDADVRSPGTITHVGWDRLHADDGVTVDSHGAWSPTPSSSSGTSFAWDVDALRGARAVRATTDVDAAARPFDRAEAATSLRDGGWTLFSGIRAMALRGGDAVDLGTWGPVAGVRRGDAVGRVGAYDVSLEGGEIADTSTFGAASPASGATAFARGEGNLVLAERLGAFGASLAIRASGDAAADREQSGTDGVVQARAGVSLPLMRAYPSSDPSDPWLHRVEPRVELAALDAHESAILASPAARGMVLPAGAAWIGSVGVSSAFGRRGSRDAIDLDVRGGVVRDDAGALPLIRARLSASGLWVGASVDFARVLGSWLDAAPTGGALLALLRVGRPAGLHVIANVAERDGVDPVVARALVDPPYDAASGFLAATGWTGGAHLGVPIGSRITLQSGADADLSAHVLVAAAGAVEVHDPCNCVVVRLSGAHRIGRPGVDAWVTVDLPLASR